MRKRRPTLAMRGGSVRAIEGRRVRLAFPNAARVAMLGVAHLVAMRSIVAQRVMDGLALGQASHTSATVGQFIQQSLDLTLYQERFDAAFP